MSEATHAGPILVAAGLVWLSRQRVLVHRRPLGSRFGGGRLELPGGKLERGEGPRSAMARELREEWGPATSAMTVGPVAEVLHHVYPAPGPEVILVVYHVDGSAWHAAPDPAAALTPAEGLLPLAFDCAALPVQQFLDADADFIAAVRSGAVASPFG